MLPTTLKILRTAFEADPSITVAERQRLMQLVRQGTSALGPKPETTTERVARIIRRAEVARRLSCSLRTVDKLPLKKVKLPGRTRAAGFLESDVNALLAT